MESPLQPERIDLKRNDLLFTSSEQIGLTTDGEPAHSNETQLNNWQKISAATGTIVTPGNVIDIAALGLAKYGLDHLDSRRGIGASMAGFMSDFVDGKVARKTQTESALGEAFDAAGDKVKLAYALTKLWQKDVVPKELLTAVAVQNSINVGLTIADRVLNKDDPKLHASWYGKRAIFMQQWGLGLKVLASRNVNHDMRGAKVTNIAGNVLSFTGLACGAVATVGYARTLWQSRQKD